MDPYLDGVIVPHVFREVLIDPHIGGVRAVDLVLKVPRLRNLLRARNSARCGD
jgi:hypothetical protein